MSTEKTRIIDGHKIATEIKTELQIKIKLLRNKGIVPHLATIIIGKDKASILYAKSKSKSCRDLGIREKIFFYDCDISQKKLLEQINQLNTDKSIHGIIVQTPVPRSIQLHELIFAIAPEKDVECVHPLNIGKIVVGEAEIYPCTASAIHQIMIREDINPENKHVVIVGRSNIVGKPLLNILIQKRKYANATVTICHTGTEDISNYTRMADILIVAAGSPNMITGDMVKDGVMIIDAGINRIEKNGKYVTVGDVDFKDVVSRCKSITPVPGGVGPVTVSMLLFNVVKLCERIEGVKNEN